MKPLHISTLVDAAPELVFAAASDFQNAPERVSGIERVEMLTEGPLRVGTRFRETRTMFGKQAVEEMEVIDLQPGRSYTLGADSCGCRFESVVSCTPEGTGTRLAIEMVSTPKTLAAKLMAPLGAVMAGAMKKAMQQDLEDIRRSVEADKSA